MKSLFAKKNKKQQFVTYTPEHTISAFIELPTGINPIEAIWHTSSIALDTEKICLIYTLADDGVYFIAAPALDLLGYPDSATPLAAALPGNEHHQGDGAYLCSIGNNLFAVMIKGKESLSCFIGDQASVLQFAEGQPTFWVDSHISTPWLSLTQYQQKDTISLLNKLSIGSFAGIIFFTLLSLFFNYETGKHLEQSKKKQNAITLEQQKSLLVLNANKKNNSTNLILKKYLELSTYIIQQQGRIISYEAKNNSIKYKVELPQTSINLNFFGKEVMPVIKDNVITIEKEEKF